MELENALILKILVIGSTSRSLVNFRGKMLQAFVERGHEVYAASQDLTSDTEKRLKDWGIIFHKIDLDRGGTNPKKDLKGLLSIKKLIQKTKPDLVISYTVKPVLYGSLAARICGVRDIFSIISGLGTVFINTHGIKNKLINLYGISLYKVAGKINKGFIFQNPDDKRLFIKKKIIKSRKAFQINGSGVDLEHYSFSTPNLEKLRFLFVGRFLKEKGILDYLEAAQRVKEKFPFVTFEIVGRIEPHTTLEVKSKIKEAKKTGFVNFHPYTLDIRPLLRNASVFVLPSYREGTPRTGLEAMSIGRPLIMANTPGCKETVIEGQNGYLVPVKNPEALADAMEKFIKNPSIIKTMAINSRKIAETKFDVGVVNNKIIEILGA